MNDKEYACAAYDPTGSDIELSAEEQKAAFREKLLWEITCGIDDLRELTREEPLTDSEWKDVSASYMQLGGIISEGAK